MARGALAVIPGERSHPAVRATRAILATGMFVAAGPFMASGPPVVTVPLLPVWQVFAQAPGYQQIDVRSIRAEYNAEVLTRINAILADWGDAWANDRAEELAGLYWEDAILVPPDGGVYRGRAEIRAYFDSALPRHGHIEAFMLDFDASGGMSQVFGNYMLGFQQGDRAGSQATGPMVTVYMSRGRTWLIRSQIFLPPSS